MKKINTLLALLLLAGIAYGQSPKWAKKARQAQVTIVANDAQGTLHESQGIIINREGEVITEYDALKGAVRATVITASGEEYPVRYVCGANSMYNVTKLQVELPEKNKLFIPEQAETPTGEGNILWILPNAKSDKKAQCRADTVTAITALRDSFTYFTLAQVPSERMASSPVMNEEGKLVGLLQMPVGEGKNSYVIDSRFIRSLMVGPLDASNNDLNSILIPKRLPDEENAAASYVFLMGNRDTATYMVCIDEFIKRFPTSTGGYTMKGEALAARGKYAEAEAAYNAGLSQDSTHKDELHYSLAHTIYRLNMKKDYEPYADWTLERASREAQLAYDANPLPLYTNLLGQSLYAEKKYDQAEKQFLALTSTNMRSAETFLYAAQCRQMAGAGDQAVLELQDSAVACFTKPYPQAAAGAILLRGRTKARMEKYREAVADMNEYEHLAAGKLGADFYYEREQLEVKSRLYPAALNDIERAIRLQPREVLFQAEAAALNYRVGQVDEALQAALQAIQTDPSFPDAWRIAGVCYYEKGDKVQARKHLEKAVNLGDQMAAGVLEKVK